MCATLGPQLGRRRRGLDARIAGSCWAASCKSRANSNIQNHVHNRRIALQPVAFSTPLLTQALIRVPGLFDRVCRPHAIPYMRLLGDLRHGSSRGTRPRGGASRLLRWAMKIIKFGAHLIFDVAKCRPLHKIGSPTGLGFFASSRTTRILFLTVRRAETYWRQLL
jgi:hypothetical protein